MGDVHYFDIVEDCLGSEFILKVRRGKGRTMHSWGLGELRRFLMVQDEPVPSQQDIVDKNRTSPCVRMCLNQILTPLTRHKHSPCIFRMSRSWRERIEPAQAPGNSQTKRGTGPRLINQSARFNAQMLLRC